MNDNGKIINFSDLKEKRKKVMTNNNEEENVNLDELIHTGLDTFFEDLEQGVTGFITFTFNGSDDIVPEIVIAGEIDPLRAMGALQHVSTSLSNALYAKGFVDELSQSAIEVKEKTTEDSDHLKDG